MKTAIALRHINFEDAGTLDTALSDHGYEIKYIDPTLGELTDLDLQQAHLLIVLGGPIGAYDEQTYPFLEDELTVVRQWLHTQRPILGICLGAQLIARALGANVYPLGIKEIGFAPLTLTSAGKHSPLAALDGIPVLHWHGDQFDIPDGGIHLASTPVGANQAFSIGSHVLGLQFHLEVDVHKLERWLIGHAIELAQTNIDPRTLRADATRYGNHLTIAARLVLANWLHNLEERYTNSSAATTGVLA
ncbi:MULTISPECIES: glutamine amidotransferase [Burkholderia]|uniref:glutamine amidotransferase n=1 Tax=Burkholderia TaxID=32008 RepID=UPI00128DF0C8|nr:MULTISPECIES: glutamine amidotransferase [Burkholderia]MPV67158.1 glutamine amidotransferase [Burkholderia sp. BE17]UVE69386.1 glutamine amidotransferase [Burkholderia pyrrocinia]